MEKTRKNTTQKVRQKKENKINEQRDTVFVAYTFVSLCAVPYLYLCTENKTIDINGAHDQEFSQIKMLGKIEKKMSVKKQETMTTVYNTQTFGRILKVALEIERERECTICCTKNWLL